MSFTRSLLFVFVLELLVAALALYTYGFTLEGLQATTRFSGRLSLVLFSVIFILLPRNPEKLFTVFSEKPFLIFAVAHGIHLIELVSFIYLSKNELIPIRAAGGFVAYILIFAMPLIQQYAMQGRITERKYNVAESIYLYYVWFIFFMSYLPRVQGKLPHVGGTYTEFVMLMFWVCLLMGIKVASHFRPTLKR